ncbi:MAG TPA: hypothetical protein PKL63_10460 [Dermatophilaceae bacterium]|nr:hypothetical protein [Dermatophilaceae bacterium]
MPRQGGGDGETGGGRGMPRPWRAWREREGAQRPSADGSVAAYLCRRPSPAHG